MKRSIFYNHLVVSISLLCFAVSCSKMKEAKEFFTQPTAREKYAGEFEKNSPLLAGWEEAFENAVRDSVMISLPYSENGKFSPSNLAVYSYGIDLKSGERLQVKVKTDSANALVFLDLFHKQNDSLGSYKQLSRAEYASSQLEEEISSPGIYKLIIQPELAATTAFNIEIYKEPIYNFPVASKGNSNIHSVWGATRDAGRRKHEGIDIFASRGTAVVAATKGRISSTGNRGLGGKQVWLRDSERGNSIYYAHLDSITAISGMKVSRGDTLGFVGNTGNARSTAPHLHFGIYKGYRGALDPLPYVYKTEKPEINSPSEIIDSRFIVSRAAANLRKGPSTKAVVAGKVNPQDTLSLLGETSDWYHTRLKNENFFLHKSLATPL